MAEKKHRHLVDLGLAMMSHASLPLHFWDETFYSSIYLINRLSTPILLDKTPLVVLFNQKSHYSFLNVFGCLCYPYLRPYNCHKLEPKVKACTFLDYCYRQKGYKLLSPSSRLYISKNVIFNEYQYPFIFCHLSLHGVLLQKLCYLLYNLWSLKNWLLLLMLVNLTCHILLIFPISLLHLL